MATSVQLPPRTLARRTLLMVLADGADHLLSNLGSIDQGGGCSDLLLSGTDHNRIEEGLKKSI
jgi:hypothetical protein